MPRYAFTLTDTAISEAFIEIDASSFQEACAEVARRSKEGAIEWGVGPDGRPSSTVVRAVSKDGSRVAGVTDPVAGKAPGWYGLNRGLDVDDLPDEFRAIKD